MMVSLDHSISKTTNAFITIKDINIFYTVSRDIQTFSSVHSLDVQYSIILDYSVLLYFALFCSTLLYSLLIPYPDLLCIILIPPHLCLGLYIIYHFFPLLAHYSFLSDISIFQTSTKVASKVLTSPRIHIPYISLTLILQILFPAFLRHLHIYKYFPNPTYILY